MPASLIYSTWPDEPTAAACARTLVDKHLAACVTLLPTARSFYRWQGTLEDSAEVVMLAKTDWALAETLRDAILGAHPYEIPCVLALTLDPAATSTEFSQWVARETCGKAVAG